MTDEMKQILGLFSQPAFFAKDGKVLWCNAAAQSLLQIGEALPVDPSALSLLDSEGTMQLPLRLQGRNFHASVRLHQDVLLFVLAGEEPNDPTATAMLNASASLRKPLHSLMSAAGELFEQIKTDDAKTAASEVNRAIYRMMRLCNQMADGSRLLLEQMSVHRVTMNLNLFFTHFVQTVRPLVEASNRTLEFSMPDQRLQADADAELLERALFNLIANAIAYTPKDGVIAVNVQRHGRQLLISVSDNGEGVEEHLSDLFERYVDRPVGDSRWGVGLGLPMVRQIARVHGGTVVVHSNGNGTTVAFSISLTKTKMTFHAPMLRWDYCSGLDHALVELSDVLDREFYDPSVV